MRISRAVDRILAVVFVFALPQLAVASQTTPPLGNQAKEPPVYTPDLKTLAEVPGWKTAMLEGATDHEGDRFLIPNLDVLQPVSVMLIAPESGGDLSLRLFKEDFKTPLREASTKELPVARFLIRTQGELRILVSSNEGQKPYQLIIWVGDEMKVPVPSLFVPISNAGAVPATALPASGSEAAANGGSVVLWIIAGSLFVMTLLLALIAFRKRSGQVRSTLLLAIVLSLVAPADLLANPPKVIGPNDVWSYEEAIKAVRKLGGVEALNTKEFAFPKEWTDEWKKHAPTPPPPSTPNPPLPPPGPPSGPSPNPNPSPKTSPDPFGKTSPDPFGKTSPDPFGKTSPDPFGKTSPDPFGKTSPAPFRGGGSGGGGGVAGKGGSGGGGAVGKGGGGGAGVGGPMTALFGPNWWALPAAIDALMQLYEALTAEDAGYWPEYTPPGMPGIPTACVGDIPPGVPKAINEVSWTGPCGECFEAAHKDLEKVLQRFEKLRRVHERTVLVYNTSIAFGNAASMAGGIILAAEWMEIRNGIQATYANYNKVYDAKVVELSEALQAALRKIADCEHKHFNNPSWYDRYGFMFVNPVVERHRR